jgi:hypothetical protein
VKYHTFLPQFHSLIIAGSKVTTIRGSTRVKQGERFALRYWTGKAYRSPMGFIGTATCEWVQRIQMGRHSIVLRTDTDPPGSCGWDGDLEKIARWDGFPSWSAMRDHFGRRLPFEGVLIKWRDFKAGAP